MNWTYAGGAARIALGLVFLVSGLHKAAAPAEEFAVVIEAYRLISAAAAANMASILPWGEILLGLSLVGGYLYRYASAAAGGFLLLFIAALGSTIFRGIGLANCGCFGGSIHLTQYQALGLDSALLCLAYLAYRKGSALSPIETWIERGT